MTTPDFASNRENFCYRHPDRQSFVLCQRCMRTICAECQTQAPVGVICPECMKEQRKAQTPAQRKANRRWGGSIAANGQPIVTYALLAVTTVFGVLQVMFGKTFDNLTLFWALYLLPDFSGVFEPWRLFTSMFVHGGLWHFLLNMLALWMIGRILEPMIGRWRYLALYLIGGVGGSVAVAVLSPLDAVVGASGAIFALMGALLVIGRQLGGDVRGILVILGLNLAVGIFIAGISWQAHVGGVIVGALIGLIYSRTRERRQRTVQILLLVALTAVLVIALAIVPPMLLPH